MRKKKSQEQAEDVASESGARLTPIDVQQKEFRLAFRGYNERDVDAFLDEVTGALGDLIEENRRLRQGAGIALGASLAGGAGSEDAMREAEEILARAREEAGEIVREAEARAVPAGSSTPVISLSGAEVRAISSFLSREREFLQSLAGLIQGHAESVKGMARAARDGAVAASTPSPASATAAAEEPATSSEPEAPRRPILSDRPSDVSVILAGSPASPRREESRAPEDTGPSDVEERGHTGEEQTVDVSDRAPVAAEREPAAADDGERSLRELFWGED